MFKNFLKIFFKIYWTKFLWEKKSINKILIRKIMKWNFYEEKNPKAKFLHSKFSKNNFLKSIEQKF